MMHYASGRKKLIPLAVSVLIILADQLTKELVVRNIPLRGTGFNIMNGFLRIIHTRNKAVAFSLGRSLPPEIRTVIFIAVPLILLTALLIYFIRKSDMSSLQRWAVAGIIGGGLGNLFDRVFRPLGVVDFIDFKFYGVFGFQRWPTFNIADAAIVISGILLILSMINQIREEERGDAD